ncbi:SURF1 family protein [Martelella mediterranea]|uniref:SURF1-like protein n=1 Tax=Martelella mediterranea TaxID=293089 RepID=A0A4R3NWR8_9HYPH|nr:SURF1 family protein [Martelella mediterranea]TCT44517.1 surfeit locus 1 family protein [Martelella mediterranea]
MSTTPRNWFRISVITAIAAVLFAGFVGLGIWQLYRLQWKLDLIEAVNTRVEAPAVPAPGPEQWSDVTRQNDAYRHVEVKGRFLNDQEVQIYYPTELGPGYFVMTPLQRPDGTYLLINRGFVPEEKRDPSTRQAPEGEVTVTGLLRMSEDKGWLFSRKNEPEDGKWYRRDVGSIMSTKGLEPYAPYFIDADNTPNAGGYPIGGLTVVKFRNAHLSYALTWFAMALGTLALYVFLLRVEGVWGSRPLFQDDDDE